MEANPTDGNGDCVIQFDLTPQEISTSEEKEENNQDGQITNNQDLSASFFQSDNGLSDQEKQDKEEATLNPTMVKIEQVDEINNELVILDDECRSSLIAINGYQWKEGHLQLRYLLSAEETQWVDLRDAKTDNPRQ
eukprot:14406239-Ditylum_brightwellii.AAC.1